MTRFLNVQEVIEIHDQLIIEFGGSLGLRDLGLLVSAVEMPKSTMSNVFLHPTLFDQAAAYLFHITRNHPFLDGNKRTAAVSALVFLEDNHISIKFNGFDLENLIVCTAMGMVTKEEISLFLSQSLLKENK